MFIYRKRESPFTLIHPISLITFLTKILSAKLKSTIFFAQLINYRTDKLLFEPQARAFYSHLAMSTHSHAKFFPSFDNATSSRAVTKA